VVARERDLPPAPRAGLTQDLRLLVDYRDQLVCERTRVQNRLHADLVALVPGYDHRVHGLASKSQRAKAQRVLRGVNGVRAELGRARLARIEAIDDEVRSITETIAEAVVATDTGLMHIPGVGAVTAAKILGEAGDVRRFRSAASFAMASGAAPIPASSGQTVRHRLNRGGNRQLNRALHTIALAQARVDQRAQVYLARKRAEGKTHNESIRCLKRHLADVVYRCMIEDGPHLGT
jgi:transposase